MAEFDPFIVVQTRKETFNVLLFSFVLLLSYNFSHVLADLSVLNQMLDTN